MYVLRRFAAWYGNVQLRHLAADKVGEWFYGDNGLRTDHRTRDGRYRAPVAASTHNYYRSRLNSFFRFCIQRGLVKKDLLAEVDPLRVPTVLRQRPSPTTLNEMVRTAPNDRDRALLQTLIHTALRKSEVAAIRVNDVDLDEGWLIVRITKSHLEDRLPITVQLNSDLRRWMRTYATDIGRPLAADDHLFPARHSPGFRWRTEPDGMRVRFRAPDIWLPQAPMAHAERVVHDALHRVGLPTIGEGAHTLRRAAARAFFDELTQDRGYDSALRVVSAWLHHKNSSTTEQYLGLDLERKRRDEWLRGNPSSLPAPVPR